MEAATTTKTCSACGRETRSTHRAMCANCYRIWQRDNFPPNAACDVCDRQYFRRPGARTNGRTCSRSCFSKWKQGRDCFNRTTDGSVEIERRCEVCSKQFTAEKRRVARGMGRYCSLQCNAIRRRLDPVRSSSPENAWRQREGFTKLSQQLLSAPGSSMRDLWRSANEREPGRSPSTPARGQ